MKGELVWCYLNPCVGSADDAGQSALELKVVPQGSDISEYDAYAGDDEDAQEEPGEPEAEPEDQPLAAAVRSLEEAMETEKERHSVVTTDAGEQEQEKTKPERANCIAAQESDTENRRCQEEACSMEKAATTKRKPEKSHQSYGVQTRAYTTSPPPHEQKRENR